MLHARELAFVHPQKGKEMSFAAQLPEDFQEALKSLRI
jgi:23S rRNA-/tRNA-specific pseudouridylate synthase